MSAEQVIREQVGAAGQALFRRRQAIGKENIRSEDQVVIAVLDDEELELLAEAIATSGNVRLQVLHTQLLSLIHGQEESDAE